MIYESFLFSITSFYYHLFCLDNFCGFGCVSVLPGMYCWLFTSCVNHGHVVDFNGLISVNGLWACREPIDLLYCLDCYLQMFLHY